VLVGVVLFSSLYGLKAQEETRFLKFTQDSLHLGKFSFDNRPTIQKYDFVVVGESAITIKEIETDCACITVDYPKKPLNPNEKGSIRIAFFPYKSGSFEKVFTVKTNGSPKEQELLLTGYIEIFLPNPQLEFPHLIGNFRFKNRHISLGNITNEGVVRKAIEFYNASDKTITLLDSSITPTHIEVLFDETSKSVAAGSRSFFDLYYHPETKDDYGYLVDNIVLFSDDSLTSRLDLTVTSVITQYFPPTEEIDFDKVPKLEVSNDAIELGRVILSRYSVELVKFNIKNEGPVPLKIFRANGQDGTKVVSEFFSEILPQDSVQLKIQIKDIGKSGKQERTVLLYTNDPLYPVKPLKIQLDVRRH